MQTGLNIIASIIFIIAVLCILLKLWDNSND